MKKDSHSFKSYLLKLVDDYSPDEKKKVKKKEEDRDDELPTGLLKYIQISNAGDK